MELKLRKEDMGKTFANLFNIDAQLYSGILISCLDIDDITLRELKRSGKVYLSDLLLMTSKEVLALLNVGDFRLNQLLKLFYEIKKGNFNLDAYEISCSRNIPLSIVINKDKLAKGDFSSIETNKKNANIIFKYEQAQKIVGTEIAEICIYSPNRILPVISALSSFHTHQNFLCNKRRLLVELLSKVPDERKDKPIFQYIQLFPTDIYCKNTLKKVFCHNSIKLTFEEINNIVLNEIEYKIVIDFLGWFILSPKFYIKKSIRMATLGYKNRILNLRIKGYTYKVIAAIIGIKENTTINKHNEIINIYFADNNSLTAMLLLSLDKGKKHFSENELNAEFGELTPKLIYLYSHSTDPCIRYDTEQNQLIIR